MLNEKQQLAFDAMMAGKNVFLTGDAGCGKSFVISEVIRAKKGQCLVCAPTGIAALNLPEGMTLHRAFGLSASPVYGSLYWGGKTSDIAGVSCIIIDEISMVRADLFDTIASIIFDAMTERPIQVIVVGDFFQLPPVLTDRDVAQFRTLYPKGLYAFESGMWDLMDFEVHRLTEIIRQDDKEYQEQLNLIRLGDTKALDYFNARVGAKISDKAIRLYGTNKAADVYNLMRLQKLQGETMVYHASTFGDVKASDKPCPDKIELAKDARVMILTNDPDGLYANGTMGTVAYTYPSVVGVMTDDDVLVEIEYKEWDILALQDDGKTDVVGKYRQIPLKLAYAVTIHKSQGQTYDECYVDPKCFSNGQLYVALSRCRRIEGLSLLKPIKAEALMTAPEVIDFYGVNK